MARDMMFGLKPLIAGYMVCGVAVGMVIEPYQAGKQPLPLLATTGIAAVTLVLVAVNVRSYRTASKELNPAFPTSAFERFLPPVAASLSLVIGLGIILVK